MTHRTWECLRVHCVCWRCTQTHGAQNSDCGKTFFHSILRTLPFHQSAERAKTGDTVFSVTCHLRPGLGFLALTPRTWKSFNSSCLNGPFPRSGSQPVLVYLFVPHRRFLADSQGIMGTN